VSNDGDIIEITSAVVFAIVGDRLRFTLTSGQCSREFSMSFHLGLRAVVEAGQLLAEREICAVTPMRGRERGQG
jgi:hypothetical protein